MKAGIMQYLKRLLMDSSKRTYILLEEKIGHEGKSAITIYITPACNHNEVVQHIYIEHKINDSITCRKIVTVFIIVLNCSQNCDPVCISY